MPLGAAMRHEAGEQHEADDRQAISARVVHTALRQEGEEQLERSSTALAWSALAAGISMGLSLMAQGVLRHHLPDTDWRVLITSLGYAVGFIAVTLGRQQLFTETTLTAMLPFRHHKRMDVLRTTAVGRRLYREHGRCVPLRVEHGVDGDVLAWAEQHDGGDRLEAVGHDFATAFVKAIFGGWMIALMVWLMPAAQQARIWVILIVTWCLAAAELTPSSPAQWT